jgi:hypothetical protein
MLVDDDMISEDIDLADSDDGFGMLSGSSCQSVTHGMTY